MSSLKVLTSSPLLTCRVTLKLKCKTGQHYNNNKLENYCPMFICPQLRLTLRSIPFFCSLHPQQPAFSDFFLVDEPQGLVLDLYGLLHEHTSPPRISKGYRCWIGRLKTLHPLPTSLYFLQFFRFDCFMVNVGGLQDSCIFSGPFLLKEISLPGSIIWFGCKNQAFRRFSPTCSLFISKRNSFGFHLLLLTRV